MSGVRVERTLHLWIGRLELIGEADLGEFRPYGRLCPVKFKRRTNPLTAWPVSEIAALAPIHQSNTHAGVESAATGGG